MVQAKQFISYIRVSTKGQGESGLGLEAQQKAVADYANSQGGKIVKEYREVESGKSNDRPALLSALAHAKRNGAVLVVAKLDRLSRNATFLSALLDADVDFVACDNAIANKLTIRILAAVAQEEREQISKRTRAALQAAKARGVQLGSNRPGHWTKERSQKRLDALERGRQTTAQAKRKAAQSEYADILPMMRDLRQANETYASIANALNEQGHKTRRRMPFSAPTVKRILDSYARQD